jgi:hypothetical protein
MSSKESLPYPTPPTEDQDHSHACMNGYIYLGYTYTGEDGDEVEAFEAIFAVSRTPTKGARLTIRTGK